MEENKERGIAELIDTVDNVDNVDSIEFFALSTNRLLGDRFREIKSLQCNNSVIMSDGNCKMI